MGLFKDKDDINHKRAEKTNIYKLCMFCQEASKIDGSLDKKILRDKLRVDENLIEGKAHIHTHEECSGCDTSTRTEKRVCRCIYYYNSNKKKDCDENCKLCLKKWNNIGEISIENYEIPMKSVYENVGGIDLILNYEGHKYGAEVKPWYSNETISRMVAETLTYTSAIEDDYKPAILVFENSKQYKALNDLDNNEYWQIIKKYVTVFVISAINTDLDKGPYPKNVDFRIEKYE